MNNKLNGLILCTVVSGFVFLISGDGDANTWKSIADVVVDETIISSSKGPGFSDFVNAEDNIKGSSYTIYNKTDKPLRVLLNNGNESKKIDPRKSLQLNCDKYKGVEIKSDSKTKLTVSSSVGNTSLKLNTYFGTYCGKDIFVEKA
ncbi:hypothetical protein A3F66_02150 [candidate division TM6 bacterium RIFCSPHIGHO2_12_FULL_32_22]|nr:MAG: hypothetical protein A3F66_02150 [candidate division TM6 bacterium RIFCSPHIGHO2_12_FULL_32_22]